MAFSEEPASILGRLNVAKKIYFILLLCSNIVAARLLRIIPDTLGLEHYWCCCLKFIYKNEINIKISAANPLHSIYFSTPCKGTKI